MTNQDSQSLFGSSCSPFFLTGILTSSVSGVLNQVRALKMAKRDIEYEKTIAEIKERYADYKAERDIAATILKKQQKRLHKRAEIALELEKDLNTAELKMFLKDWPLVLDINTILHGLGSANETSLYFIIARHSPHSDKDPLSLSYNTIVDLIKKNLRMANITDDRVLTFKPNVSRIGGPSIANCFALMQSIPTVMIMPSLGLDSKTIDISIALWNQDSRVPYCQRVFSFDYNIKKMFGESTYKSEIEKKIVKVATAIAAVYNDCYRIVEYRKEAILPQFKDSFCLCEEPELIGFVINEYSSLVNPKSLILDCIEVNGAIDDSLTQEDIESIGNLASAAVAAMK